MAPGGNASEFSRKSVPIGRTDLLVNELITVKSRNVSLLVHFTNITGYNQLLVFIRYENKPDLLNNTFDKMYLVNLTGNSISCEMKLLLD